jgi:hypothetical protein
VHSNVSVPANYPEIDQPPRSPSFRREGRTCVLIAGLFYGSWIATSDEGLWDSQETRNTG